MKTARKYTYEQKTVAMERMQEGASIADVALDLDIAPNTLRSWRRTMRHHADLLIAERRQREAHRAEAITRYTEQIHTIAQIAEDFGVNKSTVRAWLAEEGVRRTAAESRELKRQKGLRALPRGARPRPPESITSEWVTYLSNMFRRGAVAAMDGDALVLAVMRKGEPPFTQIVPDPWRVVMQERGYDMAPAYRVFDHADAVSLREVAA